jgi:hypothetical protein
LDQPSNHVVGSMPSTCHGCEATSSSAGASAERSISQCGVLGRNQGKMWLGMPGSTDAVPGYLVSTRGEVTVMSPLGCA